VVAPKVTRSFVFLAGLVAIGYLVAMVVTGALPQNRQRVQFEAKGVMQLEPERVVRVELVRGTDRAVFVRAREAGWTREGAGSVAPAVAEKLSLAVQYMHTAGPLRVLEPAELGGADLRAFGLDRPLLSVALHADSGLVLRAQFGGSNPDNMAQYMTVEGRGGVVLMSRFVADEWLAVADSAFPRR
jgi:hypothetical protein